MFAKDAVISHSVDRLAVSTATNGEINQVRIGRWRVLTTTDRRRLVEARELACRRVVVRLQLRTTGTEPACEVWQLYDLEGHLDAAMQTTADGQFAMLTNYRTRQACRLMADGRGAMKTVESWRI